LLESHKASIKDVFARLSKMHDNWVYLPCPRFMLFQCGSYFKLECLVNCEVERVFTMLSDKSAVTRKQWDPHCGKIMQLEEFKLMDGVIFTIQRNDEVGIQWERPSNGLIVYKKCYNHPRYKSIVGSKDNEAIFWMTAVDEKCLITIISLSAPFAVERILAMEKADYRKIYSSWKCPTCKNNVFAHELECRICKTERYARCKLGECNEAQEQGAFKCPYCNTLL